MASEDRTDASAGVRFQTDLEQEHLEPAAFGTEPALLINPRAHPLILLGAAQARMQAIHNGLSAWLQTADTSADLHEVLRPFEHLAQEVVNLLEGLRRSQLAAEVANG